MAFQSATLTASSGTGYSILNATPTNDLTLSCRTGEFWVRPVKTATVTASGTNGALTSPAASGVVSGWLHLLPGDKVSFGVEKMTPETLADSISQVDAYCIASGELLANEH